MAKYDFYVLYTENIDVGLFFLLFSLINVWLIMRKHIYSIYDPMFFFLILAASGYSVVYFLYYMNLLSDYYLIMFLITQLAFFSGWKTNKAVKLKSHKEIFVYNKSFNIFYAITSFAFLSSQLIVYKYKGIPLFTDSRLEVFAGGSGFGIFNRIIIVSSTIALSIALFRITYIKRRKIQKAYDAAFVIFYLIVQLLSGSKAGLLIIVFVFGLTIFYGQRFDLPRYKEKKIKKYMIWLVALSVPVALLVIYVQSLKVYGEVQFEFLLVGLMMRFVNTGDIFFMAWPDNFIQGVLSPEKGFFSLFKDFLGATRLVPQEELPIHMGLAIFDAIYHNNVMSGPNARHNVFGLFYFGPVGGVIYSFILGWIVGFIRNKAYYFSGNNVYGLSFYVSMAFFATYIEQDFSSMAMMYYFSFVILFPFLYLICTMLYNGRRGPYEEK